MEVKIGVQHAPRELVLESNRTSEEVRTSVLAALADASSGVLEMTDEHGRLLLVPVAKVAYVEIGEASARKVGFGAM